MSQTTSAPLLQVRQLTKKYGKRLAVQGLDMNVYQGDIYGFLGPNGAGKTTTIRMILGLIQKSGGDVLLDGKRLQDIRDPFAEMGCLVEAPGLYPMLTGRQNLQVFQRLRGQIDTARVEEVLELVELTENADRKVKTYSLGMRQRLAIAVALLPNPRLLILDEPTNGLDPAGIREMRVFLRRLADRGMTILISSHLLDEIEKIANRVCIIYDGKRIAEAPLDELLKRAPRDLEIVTEQVAEVHMFVNNWLQSRGSSSQALVENGHVVVEQFAEDTAMLNRDLHAQRLSIRELHLQKPRLEDLFLSITATTSTVTSTMEGGVSHVQSMAR